MRGKRLGGGVATCVLGLTFLLPACSSTEAQQGRGGDSIRSVGSPLSMPDGAPYLDFYEDAPSPDEIALTFDDGPDTSGNCDRVLDTLKSNGVKATFFVNTINYANIATSSAGQHSLQRMVAEGHEVGSHTVHHYDLASTSIDVEKELAGVEATFRSYAPDALKTRLLRAPYGNPYFGPQWRLDQVAPIFANHGVHIGWNVDSLDWDCADAGAGSSCVVNRVISGVDEGNSGIVLLHCVLPETASALPTIISRLKTRGKRFIGVEELVVAKYGKPSSRLFVCSADSQCNAGDHCDANTHHCTAGDDPPPPPPPPPPTSSGEVDATSIGLAPRVDATVIGAGSKMIVFGGERDGEGSGVFLHDGAAFETTTGAWQTIASAPISNRAGHVAVWSGSAMYVFGGANASYSRLRSGGVYTPATNTWSSMPSAPRTLRCHPQGVWAPTTNEMIVWGCNWDSTASRYYVDGMAYRPSTRTWRTIASAPISQRDGFSISWLADRMIIWGGAKEISLGPNGTAYADGAAYDPVTNAWTMLPPAPLAGRYEHGALVTKDGKLVIYGGLSTKAASSYADGAIYDPVAGTWTPIPANAAMDGRRRWSSVWTSNDVLNVWGGTVWGGPTAPVMPTSSGFTYSLTNGAWAAMEPHAPSERISAAAVTFDMGTVVWAGVDAGGACLLDGSIFAP
jgi:peptidoglycan/xylan/chitin deacetylase (PgdA/CDA1 family)